MLWSKQEILIRGAKCVKLKPVSPRMHLILTTMRPVSCLCDSRVIFCLPRTLQDLLWMPFFLKLNLDLK